MVDFDARDDAFTSEEVDEILAVVGNLAGSFVKKNDTVDVFIEVFGGEKEVAVVAAVLVSIGDVELLKFFVDTATGFVGGEDALGI